MVDLVAAVHSVFPDASEDEVMSLLWERTGFPAFWRTDDPAECVREDLLVLKATLDAGEAPCTLCSRPVDRDARGKPEMDCADCRKALENALREPERSKR